MTKNEMAQPFNENGVAALGTSRSADNVIRESCTDLLEFFTELVLVRRIISFPSPHFTRYDE
jgi:hypothetical protein